MASSAHRASAAAARKHLRVLLPFSRDRLRIPDELAEDIGVAEALVVGRVKVWPVEVEREGGGGVFLGRGWPEFADASDAARGGPAPPPPRPWRAHLQVLRRQLLP
nr:unnamed protein product [Digitaria exilis]CAB3445208.1 unnamed protein product [Digitaria exilis]CAB3448461.1 unnamed protein product [Digitaria exilis]CAB3503195.1 unnamed protein product [Digitaria exilis]